MKQKMTALDVRALVILLRKKLTGLRLANVYDVSGRLYLLKFSKANRKEHLLIESGIRIHTTDFLRNKKDVPSGFTMKLRKHLRTKKLDTIQQLGIDRVIDLSFGKGEHAYHILVELYASGNVILTDHEYTILSLLRSHKFDETSKIQIREKYPFTASAGMTIDSITVDPEQIKKFIAGVDEEVVEEKQEQEKGDGEKAGEEGEKSQANTENQAENQQKQKKGGAGNKKGGGKDKRQQDKKKDINLKSILTKMVPYINFPYAEHVLKQIGQDPNAKATDSHIEILIKGARMLQELAKELEKQDTIKGYLIYTSEPEKEKKQIPLDIPNAEIPQIQVEEENSALSEKFKGKLLKDFGPIMLNQFQGEQVMEYDDFDQCVDEYFSQLDKQRESSKFTNKEEKIWEKMSKIKEDQEKRITGLQKEQDFSEFKAQLLQKYIYEVQAIIDILGVMQTSGISWNDINRMIKEEKKAANPLANIIYKMNFEKSSVTLLLDAAEDDEQQTEFAIDEKFQNFDPVVRVDVDLALSAQMNIKKYFEIKKKSYEKELKTKTAAQAAIKDAEVNALKEITKHRQTQKIDRMRKVFWFEKFDWFISSENYLVISGKNAQQNEALVKKYLNKGDLFMHTDMPGAATSVIKNPTGQVVPPITLNEAAIYELCHSRAWDNKIVSEVYWVHADQVSKTAPTGLYIGTGSFMIRGKRNFITPNKLELGFTLMFTLNEESIPNHIGERKPRLNQEEMEAASEQPMEEIDMPDEYVDGMSREQSQVENQEYKVVQVGEDKEAMIKKAKQQQQKKFQQNQAKKGKGGDGKDGNQKGGLNKKQQQQEEEEENKKQKAMPRGKKAKMQKIKDKYADQDEDERQMRLQLIGAKKVKGMDKIQKMNKEFSKKEEGAGTKQEEEEEQTEEQQPEEPVVTENNNKEEEKQEEQTIQDQKEQEEEKTTEEKPEDDGEVMEELKGDDNDKEDDAQDEEDEKREIEQLMKEEDINMLPEDVDVNEIDKLTGIPKGNDIIIGLVPMCAPYSAITSYKYKVKLQPGQLKRGKAQKLIKNLFVQQSNKNQTEASQIKNIPDTDMMNILINNVRVLAPGLTKMQNQTKQDKRKKPKGEGK